jgi:membrane protein
MNIKIKIIIWLFIWIITFCSSQIFCLTEIQKVLIEIINSYTFAYIAIELIIETLFSKLKYYYIIIISIIDLIISLFYKNTFAICLSIFALTLLILVIEKVPLKKIFKIQAKKELLLKVFLILSSFLLYSFFFSFIIPKYLTVNYIFAPFIFEYIKIIINSVQIKI